MSPGARQPSRQGLWGLLQKAPLSGSLGVNSFANQAAIVCRQVWDAGLPRGTNQGFKTLVIPCIHMLRTVPVGGGTLVFEHVMFFFIWGSMRSERKKNLLNVSFAS